MSISSNNQFELGRPVKSSVKWGKIRDPPDSSMLDHLLKKDEIYWNALEKLLDSGINSPLTEVQAKNLEDLFSTPEFSNFHWFVSTSLLLDPFFKIQAKGVKRIWYITMLLGTENQRPGGYTVKDILLFGGIERRNITLGRYYIKRLLEIGALRKVKGDRTYPRYGLGEDSQGDDQNIDKFDEYWELTDILEELDFRVKKIKKVVGPRGQWKKWLREHKEEGEEGVARTGFDNIIFTEGTNYMIADFVNLWRDWISVLEYLVMNGPPDDKDLLKIINLSGIIDGVRGFRQRWLNGKDEIDLVKSARGSYLLLDLSTALYRIHGDYDSATANKLIAPFQNEIQRLRIPVLIFPKCRKSE